MTVATKALLVKSRRGDQFAIAVCARSEKIDLHGVARQVGWKKARLANRGELAQQFGPDIDIALRLRSAELPVVVDTPLLQCTQVLVSTGRPGNYVLMDPHEILNLTQAIAAPIALPRSRWE